MSDGLRIIVCGGRDYEDWEALYSTLDGIHGHTPIGIVWHGNARGADSLADDWAKGRLIKVFPTPAEWAKHGKRAGPIRNQNMLGQGIDLVVAFPGGRGTADMVNRAKKAGVKVLEVPPLPRRSQGGGK